MTQYKKKSQKLQKTVRIKETVYPTKDLTEKYQQKYLKFRKLYPALKDVF